ncbi:MAG: hypothetical protein ACPG5L_07480 [Vibrio gallaecicus]
MKIFDILIKTHLCIAIVLTLLLFLTLVGCKGDESSKGVEINGDDNTVLVITESDVIQSCSALIARAENAIDCDDDEVRVNCNMCFDDEFRESLDVNVEQCIQDLTELGYCE